jgi:hypothetical protein
MGPVRLALLAVVALAAAGEAVYIPYNTSAGVAGGGREAQRARGAAHPRRRRVAQDRRPVLRRIQQLHPGEAPAPPG